MIHRIFTVYDVMAGAYLPPFFLRTDGEAKRAFEDCIRAPEHRFNAHPEQYTLFFHGEYDDESGDFTLTEAPQALGNGLDFVPKPKAAISRKKK